MKDIRKNAIQIGKGLKNIPTVWDGKESILKMKKGGSPHWRQMEWMGFFFEFLCEQLLSPETKIPGPRYGRTGFDAFNKIPWDFKTHATNTSSHTIIINDLEAVTSAIKEFGHVGVILAMGDVVYNDEKRKFQKWHQKLKGGKSEYEQERVARNAWSRFRKVSLKLKQISFIVLSNETLKRLGSFQTSFRNSNGNPRRQKVTIDLEKIDKELIHQINF